MRHLSRYLARQAVLPALNVPPAPDLRLAIVIPCLAEPGIIETLRHLHHRCGAHAEIIVVVNHALDAADEVRIQNQRTLAEIRRWSAAAAVPVHAIDARDLPPRHAGVGLARKIGMDLAAARFRQLGRADGVIASLDADCRVSRGYGARVCAYFAKHASCHAATLAFAHRLGECRDARHRQAMIYYELFLRYIALGWRHAGLPYAFASIGSCFAVRANAYARHQGMNRRKAGEDFYFLHKLARERTLGHIADARVYPSPRMTSRTPFGTGRAVADWYHGEQRGWSVVAPACFRELGQMHATLDALYAARDHRRWLAGLAPGLATYLQAAGLSRALHHMRTHARSAAVFRRHFYTWFDGLKAWRYTQRYGRFEAIESALCTLLAAMGMDGPSTRDAECLLEHLRRR